MDVHGDVQCGEEEERGERHHTLGVVSRTAGGEADVWSWAAEEAAPAKGAVEEGRGQRGGARRMQRRRARRWRRVLSVEARGRAQAARK